MAGSDIARRVVTAVTLVPLVVWAVLGLDTPGLAVVLGIVVLGAAWEWAGLAGLRPMVYRVLYALVLSVFLYAGFRAGKQDNLLLLITSLGLAWWLVALVWAIRTQGGRSWLFMSNVVVASLAGLLALGPAWLALVGLHRIDSLGPALVLILMVLIWVADSGAYFAGRRFGRSRLASRISPGKTWEGALGGLVAVVILAPVAGHHLGFAGTQLAGFVLLCAATVPASVLGDLTESLFKRQAGAKDSGRLLPGHGGLLDRIDSLLAAAPFFYLGFWWLTS